MRLNRLMAALVVLAISVASACSEAVKTSPTADKPVVQTPATTASLSSLSTGARAEVLSVTLNPTMIHRWADRTTPVRLYPGPFSGTAIIRGAAYWSATTGLSFVLVAKASEAEINFEVTEATQGLEKCGVADRLGDPPVIGGGLIKLYSICGDSEDFVAAASAHDIGHVLGFKHTSRRASGNMDIMYGDELLLHVPRSLELDEITRWQYSFKPGATIVQ